MKNIHNSFCKHFLYTFALFTLIGSVYGMKRPLEKSTESEYSTTEEKPPRIEKWRNVWVKTSDDQLFTLPEWQVDQIKVLQVLLAHQKGTNSETNPIDISKLEKNDGTKINVPKSLLFLIKTALDLASNPQGFAIFVASLSATDRETLINISFALEANTLSAALATAILPQDIQQTIGIDLLTPIFHYFVKPTKRFFTEEQQPILSQPAIKISPNGQYIVSNYIFGNLTQCEIWDTTKSGSPIATINANIQNVKFSPASTCIIGRNNNFCFIYFLSTQKGEAIDNCSCITVSPDDTYCLYNFTDEPGQINVDSVKNFQSTFLLSLKDGHTQPVNTIQYSPDGHYIISGSNGHENNLILWNGNTFEKIIALEYPNQWEGHTDGVLRADFTPDGKYIISQDKAQIIIVWDVATKQPIAKLNSGGIYFPDMLHHYIITENKATLYEILINFLCNNTIFPVNSNAIDLLENKPDSIIGWRTYGDFLLHQAKIVFDLINYNNTIKYAVESTNSEYLAIAYMPPYVTLLSTKTNQHLSLPVYTTSNVIKFSPQNDYIIIVSNNIQEQTAPKKILFTLWKMADLEKIYEALRTPITLSQARFLYRLYIARINNVRVVIDQNDPDYTEYISLPNVIKNLVDKFLPFDIAQKTVKEL